LVDSKDVAKSGMPNLAAKVIEYGAGGKGLVEIGNSIVLFETTNFKEASVPDFEKVREEVLTAYKDSNKSKAAEAAADTFLKSLNEGKDFAVASAESGLKVEKTGKVSRQQSSSALFSATDSREKLFLLNEKGALIDEPLAAPNALYVARLLSKDIDPEKKFDTEEVTLSAQEQTGIQQRFIAALMDNLKKSAAIEINPEIFDRLST